MASTSGSTQAHVELSALRANGPLQGTPPAWCSMQFNRSSSFSAQGTPDRTDACSDDSSCSSICSMDGDYGDLTDQAGKGAGLQQLGAAVGRRPQPFEALQVEEGSTEVAFLRQALSKKVGAVADRHC